MCIPRLSATMAAFLVIAAATSASAAVRAAGEGHAAIVEATPTPMGANPQSSTPTYIKCNYTVVYRGRRDIRNDALIFFKIEGQKVYVLREWGEYIDISEIARRQSRTSVRVAADRVSISGAVEAVIQVFDSPFGSETSGSPFGSAPSSGNANVTINRVTGAFSGRAPATENGATSDFDGQCERSGDPLVEGRAF